MEIIEVARGHDLDVPRRTSDSLKTIVFNLKGIEVARGHDLDVPRRTSDVLKPIDFIL